MKSPRDINCPKFLLPYLLATICAATGAFAASVTVSSTGATGDPPSAIDNDFTRINTAIQNAMNGDTITLVGTFDWTEVNAAASWALGSDGIASTSDDYAIDVPGVDNVTLTATSLGAATIQGPGDLLGVGLEAFLVFESNLGTKTFQNWTVSNLVILDFDLAIGMFATNGSRTAFNDTTITGNRVRILADLVNEIASLRGVLAGLIQNFGIHLSYGTNQTVSNNTIEISGDGNSAGGDPVAASMGIAWQRVTPIGEADYDGLLIDDNEIQILNAQSATPESIIGIWDDSLAHASNLTISNNNFVNLHVGNNPATNIQRAFGVSSHSSASTTVAYRGNSLSGAERGFSWAIGQNFSAFEAVELTSNTATNNEMAVRIRSSGAAVLRCNRFFGNVFAVENNGAVANADAEDNWFGCNGGPGTVGCDPNMTDVTVDADPWLVLSVAADPTSVSATVGMSTVTADLNNNSNGAPANCTTPVPDGVAVLFAGTLGAVNLANETLAGGSAQTTFTAGATTGAGRVDATIDGQTTGADITITAPTPPNLAVSVSDGLCEAVPASNLIYEVKVTNLGGTDAIGASIDSTTTTSLGGCTWTCTTTGGATCAANAVPGIFSDTANIPGGTSVTYSLTCPYTPAVNTDFAKHTVTATLASDSDLSNNTNTDSTESTLSNAVIFCNGFEEGNTSAW